MASPDTSFGIISDAEAYSEALKRMCYYPRQGYRLYIGPRHTDKAADQSDATGVVLSKACGNM